VSADRRTLIQFLLRAGTRLVDGVVCGILGQRSLAGHRDRRLAAGHQADRDLLDVASVKVSSVTAAVQWPYVIPDAV